MIKKVIYILCSIVMFLNYSYAQYIYDNGLEVRTEKPGVKVYLDDVYLGKTKSLLSLNVYRITNIKPGLHDLRCETDGFEDYVARINIPENKIIPHDVTLIVLPPVTKKRDGSGGVQTMSTGVIIVKSYPTGASVWYNKKPLKETTDFDLTDAPIGMQEITVYFRNQSQLKIQFELNADDTITVFADFEKQKISIDVKYLLNIKSSPVGDVYINGNYMGNTKKLIQKKLNSDSYTVKITRDGYYPFEKRVQLQGNIFLNPTLKVKPKYTTLSIDKES